MMWAHILYTLLILCGGGYLGYKYGAYVQVKAEKIVGDVK